MALISGSSSVRAMTAAAAAASGVVEPAAGPTAATMTGWSLMLTAETRGSTPTGRVACAIAVSMAARVSLMLVPYSNCATTSDSELADVDERASSRGTLLTACSMGTVTCWATSSAPAPGWAAMTVMNGSSMSGSSSWWSDPHATNPLTNNAAASSSTMLLLRRASSVSRIMGLLSVTSGRGRRRSRASGSAQWVGGEALGAAPGRGRDLSRRAAGRPARPASSDASRSRMSWAPRSWNWLHDLLPPIGEGDHDLPTIGGILVASHETHLGEPVDVAADRGLADAEPGGERRTCGCPASGG